MAVFRKTVVSWWLRNVWIAPDGSIVEPETPGARLVAKRRVKANTPGATKKNAKSSKWYGRIPGSNKDVPLARNKSAAQIMYGKLIKSAELRANGVSDPCELHQKRPLGEHLDDWSQWLRADDSTEKHVLQTVRALRRLVTACEFSTISDISASKVKQYLAQLRAPKAAIQLDPNKDKYRRTELAAVLGMKASALTPFIARHKLPALGHGKARRYPKETAEAIVALRSKGISVKTSNLILDAAKAFCSWLVVDRRASENPLAELEAGDIEVDRRHDRRLLDEDELRRLIEAAQQSTRSFRGLSGTDRAKLYLTACTTGFRAQELSSLAPIAFDLDDTPPTVTLSAMNAKNSRTAVQPLPPPVAESLKDYLVGRPEREAIWPGLWYERAAQMIRIDLEAAGIKYQEYSPDGLLYADFHALRHSYIGLLDKTGATLKEAMKLARHSDPKLTMRVYGKKRLQDLGATVDRMPNLANSKLSTSNTLSAPVCTRFALASDRDRGQSIGHETNEVAPDVDGEYRQTQARNRVEAALEEMRPEEASSPTRTRTWNKPVNSRLLYH